MDSACGVTLESPSIFDQLDEHSTSAWRHCVCDPLRAIRCDPFCNAIEHLGLFFQFDVERCCVAELKHLGSLGSGSIPVREVSRDIETVTCPNCLATEDDLARDNVVETIDIVAVSRQMIIGFEPGRY